MCNRRQQKYFPLQSNGSATKYSKVINSKEGKLHCDAGEAAKPDCTRRVVEASPPPPPDISADSLKSKNSNSECESDGEGRLVDCGDFDRMSPKTIPSGGVEKNVCLK
jgi:hypothetical protein